MLAGTHNQTNTVPSNSFYTVKAVKFVVLVLIDVAAIVGNVLVCLSVYKNRRLRTKTGTLILCLSISDLIFALSVTPLSAAAIWMTSPVDNLPVWISSDITGPACFIDGILMYSLTGMSLSTMGFAAINRYICIVHSNFYRKYFTFKMIWITLLVMSITIPIFMISNVAAGLATFTFQRSFGQSMLKFKPEYKDVKTNIEIVSMVIWGLIPLLTIIICYLMIYCHVRRHNRRIGTRLAQSSRPTNITNQSVNHNNSILEGSSREEGTNSTDTRMCQEIQSGENKTQNRELKQNHAETAVATTQTFRKQSLADHTFVTRQKSAEQDTTRNPRQGLSNALRQSKSEVKVTKLLVAVFLGFCICWIPFAISHIMNIISNYQLSHVTIVAIYSASLSTAVNPFIYGAANTDFRKTYIMLLTCKKVL